MVTGLQLPNSNGFVFVRSTYSFCRFVSLEKTLFFVEVLGGCSTDLEVAVKELVGRRHRNVL